MTRGQIRERLALLERECAELRSDRVALMNRLLESDRLVRELAFTPAPLVRRIAAWWRARRA